MWWRARGRSRLAVAGRNTVITARARCDGPRCSSAPPETPDATQQRRSAKYSPSSWDYDAFLSLKGGGSHDLFTNDGSYVKVKVCPPNYQQLMTSVRDMLLKKAEPYSKLRTIDAIQRLGISYHFEAEINNILDSISKESAKDQQADDSIAFTALKFRILRENGFPTTPGPLSYHKYGSCIIKKPQQEDINRLLSLHEASYLGFAHEKILDVARTYSAKALKGLMPSMLPHLREGVTHALEIPLHWRAPRLETRWFIDYYARDVTMCPMLLQFAKLDFNKVQDEHQKDLAAVCLKQNYKLYFLPRIFFNFLSERKMLLNTLRWWRNIALGEKLPFARDRLMECFHFANGIVWDPKLGPCCQMLAKLSNLILHLDDVYDIYGTVDELVLFTDAIARWDAIANEELPEYMKALYSVIYNTSNEVAGHALKEHGCSMHYHLRKSWHGICVAFLVEAKWHHGNYRPSIQEYLENGRVSSSAPLLLLHAFAMLNSVVNMNTMAQIQSNHRLVQSASLILRLSNDSATHLDELQRGDAPSSIAIHMFENGANEQDSRKAMQDLILESCKVINEEAFDNCQYSSHINKACVNLARISHCVYQGGDGFGAPDGLKKKQITDLILEPIHI